MTEKINDDRFYDKEILFIEGAGPMREGHYPKFFKVGEKNFEQTGDPEICAITTRYVHRGDHGIGWYDVWYEHDGEREASLQLERTPRRQRWVTQWSTQMSKHDGGSAFPRALEGHMSDEYKGLSKREIFAMAAMQGILANSNINPLSHLPDIDGATIEMTDFVSGWAYEYADSMLDRNRNK